MPIGSRNIISCLILLLHIVLMACTVFVDVHKGWAVAVLLVGVVIAASPRLINEWERGVLLRLGKFRRTLDPGIYWVIPGIDQLMQTVDMRIRSTSFSPGRPSPRTRFRSTWTP